MKLVLVVVVAVACGFGVVWDWRRGEVGADINNYN